MGMSHDELDTALVPDSQLTREQVLERNKQVVRTFYESIFNDVHPERLKDIMIDEFDDHGEALFGNSHGRALLEQGISHLAGAFPGRRVHIEDMIAEGEWVGVRGTMVFPHVSPFLGTEPTGNELRWLGLSLFRVKDGKIHERVFNSDSLHILQQLGLYPPK